MEDAVRSLFLVTSFDDGPFCVAIYEIKIGGGGGGGGGGGVISPMVKSLVCPEEKKISSVGCDMTGSQIFLTASYGQNAWSSKFKQLPPLIFDTHTKKQSVLPLPKAKKPNPKVMAVQGRGFYVLGSAVENSSTYVKSPSFEHLDHHPPHQDYYWDSSSILPEYTVPKESQHSSSIYFSGPEYTQLVVAGYAVIHDNILISVVNLYVYYGIKFLCYKAGSSMEKWHVVQREKKDEKWHVVQRKKKKKIKKEEEEEEDDDDDGKYYALCGKAEYVDGYLYTFKNHCDLISYGVNFSADGIIQSLSAPLVTPLECLDPAVDRCYSYSSCFVHLGDRIFCVARTEFCEKPLDVQHVSIVTFKVSEGMHLSTLSSAVWALNIKDLGQAKIESLCFDSQ